MPKTIVIEAFFVETIPNIGSSSMVSATSSPVIIAFSLMSATTFFVSLKENISSFQDPGPGFYGLLTNAIADNTSPEEHVMVVS
jgi:hypothetical protein